MTSTTDPENFAGRVNYAASCFMRGVRNSREFDSCFEMYDGKIVVTALVRRCKKNEKLRNAIAASYGGTFPLEWCAIAEDHKFCGTRCLAALAKHIREQEEIRWEKELLKWQQEIKDATP